MLPRYSLTHSNVTSHPRLVVRTLTIDDEETWAGADPATWRILPTEDRIKDDAVG